MHVWYISFIVPGLNLCKVLIFLLCNDVAMQRYLSERDGGDILPLENLKWIHLNITYFQNPIPLLNCLFEIAPSIKSLLVSRKKGFDGSKARRYVNQLTNHLRPSRETKIFISRNAMKEIRCVNCEILYWKGTQFIWLPRESA